MTSPLQRRADLTQATLDHWKGRTFAWGSADCVQLAAWHLRRAGLKVLLSKGGRYTTLLGATRALKRAGFDDLPSALSAHGLAEIAPASVWVGDVLSLPGDNPIPALVIALGNGRVLGWHEEVEGAVVMQPVAFAQAWRVPL